MDLTKEQKEQLKTIRKSESENRDLLHEKLKVAQKNLEEAFAQDKTDDELRVIHQDILNARNEEDRARFEKLLKVRTILTPEQRKEFRLPNKEKGRGKKHGKNRT